VSPAEASGGLYIKDDSGRTIRQNSGESTTVGGEKDSLLREQVELLWAGDIR